MQTATLSALSRNDYQAYLAGMLVIAFLCHVAVLLANQFTFTSIYITLFDFASGIAVGALIVYGVRYWPAVLIGIASAHMVNQEPVPFVIAASMAVTIEAVIAARLVRYFLHEHYGLDYIPDLLKYFLIASSVVVVLGGTLLTVILLLIGQADLNEIGFVWANACMGKLTGVAVLTPFIMVWNQKADKTEAWPKLFELIFLIVVLLFCSGVVFLGWFDANISGYSRYPLAYLVFPILAWAAFRFGQRVSTAVIITV